MSAQLRLVRPRHKNRSVLVRPQNDELRSREYLTVAEVERLMKAAQHGRYGHRDATLILVAFRHRKPRKNRTRKDMASRRLGPVT